MFVFIQNCVDLTRNGPYITLPDSNDWLSAKKGLIEPVFTRPHDCIEPVSRVLSDREVELVFVSDDVYVFL